MAAGATQGPPLAEANRLLQTLSGISFKAIEHIAMIERTLSAMADWIPETQMPCGEDPAVLWIERIYKELESLPVRDPYLNIHRKGLRRLHEMSGRARQLPNDFDAVGIVPPTSQDPPLYFTPHSDVYKATHGTRVVALKRIRISRDENVEKRKHFNREAIVWKLLRHEHIVPFLGILRTVDPADPVYLLSEWMELGRLTEYLAARPSEDPLPYIRHVVEGLRYMHMLEWAHGDLKATNVLVDTQCRARIADFGQTSSLWSTGMGVSIPQSGTAAYMAPELLDPGGDDVSRKASAQSDIYALGMLVWEVHAGVHPFKGTPEYTIPLKTAKGDRPLRKDARRLVVNPDLHDDVARKNLMWEMIEGCWNNDAKRRLRLDDIRRMLKRM